MAKEFMVAQALDVFDDLFQSCGYGITAVKGIVADKGIEYGDLIAFSFLKINVSHAELVQIRCQL